MTTILDIIKCENEYVEKLMGYEIKKFNIRHDYALSDPKGRLKSYKEKIESREKQKIKIETKSDIKKDKKKIFIYLLSLLKPVSIWGGLLFELILLAYWFNGALWTWLSWLLSILITYYSWKFIHNNSELLTFKRNKAYWDYKNEVSRYKRSVESHKRRVESYLEVNDKEYYDSIEIKIIELELEIKRLESNYQESIKNFKNNKSKEFYTNIDINKLLKEQGKEPLTEITTNR